MGEENHPYDPRGLIREAYRIEEVTPEEVRVIFFDWAMTRPDTPSVRDQIRTLLAAYGKDAPSHPMSQTLRDGLAAAPTIRRRGGRKGRRG
ncbi:MAG: hypothetical protein CSA74_01670 [Rhodobacterales bacterium]|nr:MAG: hypothetical protein CSA74_01670 [Rhodobacterales bacterium]